MRRLGLCALVIYVLLMTGCAIRLEETAIPAHASAPAPTELDLSPHISIEASLYFLNSNETKLELEPRTLSIDQGGSPEQAIVDAIVAGPHADGLLPVATGLTADRVEVMPDLINVYVTRTSDSLRQWNITVFKLAVAAALIDYSGVRYVNVLLDGEAPGYTAPGSTTSLPTGVTSRPGELTEEMSVLAQRTSGAAYDAYAALYFLDSTESWLLPEVRRVTVDPAADIVDTLIAAMISGPGNKYNLRRSMDTGVQLETHEIVEGPAGRMLRLTFNRMPTVYTTSFVDGEQMAAAALAYTVVGFVPDVCGIELTTAEDPTDSIVCIPGDWTDLVGNRIDICLPNTPEGATMTNVPRVVAQGQSNDLYLILSILFRGPVDRDGRDVWPAAPDGVSARSILDVYRSGDMVVVNLDGSVSEAVAMAGPANERTLLFSIVNTLTNIKGIKSVLFLEEGERREYIGVDAICLLDPIMRNPGVIR